MSVSALELGRFEREEELLDWNVDVIADTPYDPTQYQQQLFIAPSFETMAEDVLQWLNSSDVAA